MNWSDFGLGCMGMTGFYGPVDRNKCKETIATALDAGITLFDTANNYGFGDNELLLGEALAPFAKRVCVATKVGVVRSRENPSAFSVNGTPRHIREECEKSLKRLKVPIIDLYFLHHADPETPIEETILAMSELVKEGLVRYIGLCEMEISLIRRAHKVHPLHAIQAEYSLFSRVAEKHLIPLAHELAIRFIACAPLSRGLLASGLSKYTDARQQFPRFQGDHLAHNLTLLHSLQEIADRKGCSTSQLALSWLLAQSSSIVPIFGTTKRGHLLQNIKKIALTKEEAEEIGRIGPPAGERHPESIRWLYLT